MVVHSEESDETMHSPISTLNELAVIFVCFANSTYVVTPKIWTVGNKSIIVQKRGKRNRQEAEVQRGIKPEVALALLTGFLLYSKLDTPD